MLKLNNVSNWLFDNINNFFQGSAGINRVENGEQLCVANILNAKYMEWELNQDIVDIALYDIKGSFSWILPRFMRDFASRVQQLCLLYLYTDMAEEEISGVWFEAGKTDAFRLEEIKIKVISYPQVIKDMIDEKCLFIKDWVKMSYRKLRLFITLDLLRKPYYLLDNFAPCRYEVPDAVTNCLIKEFNWVKLRPAFAFHKRI
jgi:hypothetical protein